MASSKQETQGGSGKGGESSENKKGSTSERGFAAMDTEEQREIAAKGGKAAHQSGNAHEFSSEEAREAGSMSRGGQGRNEQSEQEGQDGQSQKGQGARASGSESGSSKGSGTRGGTSEQHAEAGRQSHKNAR